MKPANCANKSIIGVLFPYLWGPCKKASGYYVQIEDDAVYIENAEEFLTQLSKYAFQSVVITGNLEKKDLRVSMSISQIFKLESEDFDNGLDFLWADELDQCEIIYDTSA